MNQPHQKVLERFYSLDVLRGIAALSVVFWHWQHFFFGPNHATFDVTRLPLYQWAFPLYTKGWLAVDLFFCLSGFVFYWLYSKRVGDGEISPAKFALLRFSRLYPLYFATLLIVAGSQLWLINSGRSYFVYQNNDSYHFFINILLASSWGIERGYSFNGPAWSVSVEVFLYLLFFVCSRMFPVRAVVLFFISIFGFFVVQEHYQPLGRGIGSFFLGGCVFLAYQAIVSSHRATVLTKWAGYLTVGTWLVTISIAVIGVDQIPFLLRIPKVMGAWPIAVLFPLTILSLSLIETRRGSLGKRVSFIGDISYSSYLLHFPLQLFFSVLVTRYSVNDSVYYSPWLMGLFFAALIAISFASFRYFEMPAQRVLRQTILARPFTVCGEKRQ